MEQQTGKAPKEQKKIGTADFEALDALKEEYLFRMPLARDVFCGLQEEFTIQYTYHSNAMGGNSLTLSETAMALGGHLVTNRPLQDQMEAVGHRDAFFNIQQMAKNRQKFCEYHIKTTHALLWMGRPEEKGVYRRTEGLVPEGFCPPVPPKEIPDKIEKLVERLDQMTGHPIERAALFHLDFEGIHPFADGNGRTGRMILNFMLMREGYLPVFVKVCEQERYNQCFTHYFKEGDAEPMIRLLADLEEVRLQKYLDAMQ